MLSDWSDISLFDLRYVRMAIRHNWKISEDVREAIMSAMTAVIDDKSTRARKIIAIGKALVLADSLGVLDRTRPASLAAKVQKT